METLLIYFFSLLFFSGPLVLLFYFFMGWYVWKHLSVFLFASFIFLVLTSLPLTMISIGDILSSFAECYGGDVPFSCTNKTLEPWIGFLTFGNGWSAYFIAVPAFIATLVMLPIFLIAFFLSLSKRKRDNPLY